MTAIECDQMSDEDFANSLFDKLEAEGPVFTLEELGRFENRLQKNAATRRMALVVLTKPFSEIQEQIENDREFAVATADIYQCTDPELYQATHDLLENARLRIAGLLACRDDMEEIFKEAERKNPGAES
ncbi:MAG: hypothetical protein G8D81_20480 [gamma proteobacterium symbiont of Clathrolucina costata]